MGTILFCSHNPILVKTAYGVLRDIGNAVECADHLAAAIQKLLETPYDTIILDSQTLGLSAEDGVRIIRAIAPETGIIVIGHRDLGDGAAFRIPYDLSALQAVMHTLSKHPDLSGKKEETAWH